MADRKKRGGGHGKKFDRPHSKVGKKSEELLEDSPLIRAFISYRDELNGNYDRYERLYKISRDITIESKRIIFQLHLISTDASKEAILQEAKTRLDKLIKYNFAQLAKELEGVSRYQYVRAYTSGVQEFVEAITFYHYLESDTLCSWNDILCQMVYPVSSGGKDEECDTIQSDDISDKLATESDVKEEISRSVEPVEISQSVEPVEMSQSVEPVGEIKKVTLFIPDWDFILGIEDLSGELMRHSIKCVSSGRIEETFKVCDFMRNLYTSLLTLSHVHNREFYKKLHVMLQSLLKVENACHMIKLRGSEMPQDLLVHMIGSFNTNYDEDCSYE